MFRKNLEKFSRFIGHIFDTFNDNIIVLFRALFDNIRLHKNREKKTKNHQFFR